MSISPQHRIGISNRRFVANKEFTDRIEPRQSFVNQIDAIIQENENVNLEKKYHVLTYYGIGGIGKSRLQIELKKILCDRYSNALYASIDLADLSTNSPAKILLELSRSFQNVSIKMYHFSLAYAIYFKKANKEYIYDDNTKTTINENLGLVSDFLSTIDGLGIIGVIPDIVSKIYSASYRKFKLDREIKDDLKKLETMQVFEIEKMLPAFFAYDVNKYLKSHSDNIIVFFFDTLELIYSAGKNSITKCANDSFLRELIAHLPGTLFTICSREYIDWEIIDPEWGAVLDQHLLENLSWDDAEDFLIKCDVKEKDIRDKIINVSGGHPYHLDLLVDTYEEIKNNNITPSIELFATSQREVLERFFKYLNPDEISVIKIMSIPRFYNFPLFKFLLCRLPTGYPVTMFDEFNKFSFVTRLSDSNFHIHDIMRKELEGHIGKELTLEINRNIAEYYENLFNSDAISYENKKTYAKESIFHYTKFLNSIDVSPKIEKVFLNFFRKLQFSGESSFVYSVLRDVVEVAQNNLSIDIFEIFTDMIMLNGDFEEAVKDIDAYLQKYSIEEICSNDKLLLLLEKKIKHQMIYLPLNETVQLLDNIISYVNTDLYHRQYIEILYTKGNMLLEQGENGSCKEVLNKAITLAEQFGFCDLQCRILRKIADLSLSENDVCNADKVCAEGLKLATENGFLRYELYLNCTQAEIYRRLKLFEKSRQIYLDCNNRFNFLGINPWVAHTELGLSLIDFEQSDYTKALNRVDKARIIYDLHNHKWGKIHSKIIFLQCQYRKERILNNIDIDNVLQDCIEYNYLNAVHSLNKLKDGIIESRNLLFL